MQRLRNRKKKAVIWMAVVTFIISPIILLAMAIPSQTHLGIGTAALKTKQWDIATYHLEKALDYGELSTTSKAMTYWNLHIACKNIQDTDCAAESLLGFIVHSTTYVDYLNSLDARHKNHPGFNWIEEYKIEQRLQFAAVLIQRYWRSKKNENKTQ